MPMDGCHRMAVNRETREGAEGARRCPAHGRAAPSIEEGAGQEQSRASELGEALLHSQEGDGALDS